MHRTNSASLRLMPFNLAILSFYVVYEKAYSCLVVVLIFLFFTLLRPNLIGIFIIKNMLNNDKHKLHKFSFTIK